MISFFHFVSDFGVSLILIRCSSVFLIYGICISFYYLYLYYLYFTVFSDFYRSYFHSVIFISEFCFFFRFLIFDFDHLFF